jgi:hypothetical protein
MAIAVHHDDKTDIIMKQKSVEIRGDMLNSTPSHWTQINLIYRTTTRTYADEDAGVQSLIDESSMKDLAPASQMSQHILRSSEMGWSGVGEPQD